MKSRISAYISGHKQVGITAASLLVSFFLSRMVFWWLGIRYDASTLDTYWQFLDIDILKNRLLPGLFWLHSQPPGFNLFLGFVLSLFPQSYLIWFQVIFLGFGFTLYTGLYRLLHELHFPRWLALLFAFAYIISPGSILYENFLFYTYPVAVLLVLAAIALHRLQATARPRYMAAFLVCIATLCAIRSIYHLVFLLFCIVLALLPRVLQRRKMIAMTVIAFCLVAGLYLKNYAVFGFFGASSWAGMNLFHVAAHAIDPDTIPSLIRTGSIPAIASVDAFRGLDYYPASYRLLSSEYASIPELSAQIKSSGEPNYNNMAYLPLSQEYMDASLYLIRHFPVSYLSSVFDSWLLYSQPSWSFDFHNTNAGALSGYTSALSFLRIRFCVDLEPMKMALFGVPRGNIIYPLSSLLFFPIIFLASFIMSMYYFFQFLRKGDSSGLALIFMTMTVLYVALVGNAVEYGENNRFRAETDPLIFVLGIILCKHGWSCIKKIITSSRMTKQALIFLTREKSKSFLPKGKAGHLLFRVVP
jgi:hypothetical protein